MSFELKKKKKATRSPLMALTFIFCTVGMQLIKAVPDKSISSQDVEIVRPLLSVFRRRSKSPGFPVAKEGCNTYV